LRKIDNQGVKDMKQIGFLISLIAIIITGYALSIPVDESFATMIFGVGLIGLATVGRKTLIR
jgi:hypothetical protein